MAKYEIRHDKNETRDTFRGDGKLALGMVLGVLGTMLVFVAFEFFWGVREKSEYLVVVPLIISLIVATGSTYFAARALLEQRRAREAGTDPVLIAHLGQREDARELVMFCVTNVGAGAALNVQIEVDEPDDKESDRSKRMYLTQIFKRHHPFSVILQGKSVEFNFALGWHLLGRTSDTSRDEAIPMCPLPPFRARVSYEDLTGARYESEFMVDVREMQHLGANKSPQMRMVAALEKIAKRE